GFVPADALAQPPNPVSSPEVGDVARKVMGRRLQTTLWIEADGTVRKAFVKRNELPDDVAVLLEQALATVRFTPGRIGDHAVPTILNARLCFDDAGVLDTTTSDCLRPSAPDAQAQGRSPAEQGDVPPPR